MTSQLEQLCRELSPICLSGGAINSDIEWGEGAKRLGHKVIHWSFMGHRTSARDCEIVRLNGVELLEADYYVKRANKTLNRVFPSSNHNFNNLLRRNWYQINWTDSVYAISHFKNDGNLDGGTAWAVQMYIDRFVIDLDNINKCNLYVFDQLRSKWYFWNEIWEECIVRPPNPDGIWTGIGTRKLNHSGRNAIRQLTEAR